MKRYKWSDCGMVAATDGVYIRKDVEIVFSYREVKDRIMGVIVAKLTKLTTSADLEHLARALDLLS